jgi:hypothetical protein
VLLLPVDFGMNVSFWLKKIFAKIALYVKKRKSEQMAYKSALYL